MGLRFFILTSCFILVMQSCGPESGAKVPAVEDKTIVEPPAEDEANDMAQKSAALEEKSRMRDSMLAIQQAKATEKAESKPKESPKKKKKKKRKSPGIMTFAEPVFNYGKIEQGDVVMHDFTFVNTGQRDLVITDIRASCGCTQPTYPFLPIAPGKSGVIGVKFDSKGKLGKMKPMVTITTDADPPINKIFLEGFVDAPAKKTEKLTQDTSLVQ